MSTATERSASVAHMLATIALQTVKENPEVLELFKAACRKAEVPFEVDDVTPLALGLAEMGINEAALLLLQGAMNDRERTRQPTVLNIPLPLDDDGMQSQTALAIGSFAVEHIRTSPERMAALDEWMQAEHGDTNWKPGDFTDERMEDADRVLTIMAHVTGVAADSGALGHIQQQAREPHVHDETCGGQYRDDGTRHV